MSYNNRFFKKISCLRHEYIMGSLRRKDLPVEPLKLFEHWLKEAYKAESINPTSMVIATVNRFGKPCQRTVLLKHYDKEGLVFYTNLNSPKALHIKNTPYVSLLFLWNKLERQVIITGKAKYLSASRAERYFRERPRDSQISAWVSRQSSFISNRDILEKKFFEFKEKFKQKEIPMPNFWGGIHVSVEQIEFWQGGKYRLHDRFLYQLIGNKWKINRLAP